MIEDRMARVRKRMEETSTDVMLLSVGADLPWLTGYEAMPLERLTMLVLPKHGNATLVVPQLEAPRVEARPDLFAVRPWKEEDDPVEMVVDLLGTDKVREVAVGDRTWATFVLALQRRLADATFVPSSVLTGPLRAVKSPEEVELLRSVARSADRVAAQLFAGEIALIGRRESEVSSEIAHRLRAEGHDRVNFSIVASGPNGASPHHEAGRRVIRPGEAVVCDFGGVMSGYCSDITRTVFTGQPTQRQREVYEAVRSAQEAATRAAVVGVPACDVDAVARDLIAEAGYGAHFIHRTGHGIGVEEHESPNIVSTNPVPLEAGNAFSIEPGIYLPDEFGVRIEDIVVARDGGSESLNRATHTLQVVEV